MGTVTKEKISALSALIDGAGRICILTHTHPDGDALGSSIAMLRWLEAAGKQAEVIIPDPYPGTLAFLADGRNIIAASENPDRAAAGIASADLLICLDFNAPSRINSVGPMLTSATAPKVLIDHHLNPDTESFGLIFSETEISSASELLYQVFMAMPGIDGNASRLPADSAYALMVGMTTDTNNFANSVFPSTLRMASELLACGVDRDDIILHVYNEYRENRVRIMGHLLYEKMYTSSNGTAYIILDAETKKRFGIQDGETEGFVNIPLSIKDIRLSLLLTEDDGYYRVSIRSKKGTSANRLARESFNGGGHECAAGGRLYFPGDIGKAGDAAQYIENVTARFMQAGTCGNNE